MLAIPAVMDWRAAAISDDPVAVEVVALCPLYVIAAALQSITAGMANIQAQLNANNAFQPAMSAAAHHQVPQNCMPPQIPPLYMAPRTQRQPMMQPPRQNNNNNPRSTPTNFVKRFENWNYCYSCGGDIAANHNSQNCRISKKSSNHQFHATRSNMMGGSRSGVHKNLLPSTQGKQCASVISQQKRAIYNNQSNGNQQNNGHQQQRNGYQQHPQQR